MFFQVDKNIFIKTSSWEIHVFLFCSTFIVLSNLHVQKIQMLGRGRKQFTLNHLSTPTVKWEFTDYSVTVSSATNTQKICNEILPSLFFQHRFDYEICLTV